MAKEKTLLRLEVREWQGHEGKTEKCIDILRNGYNIIEETIYDDDLAEKIVEIINDNRSA